MEILTIKGCMIISPISSKFPLANPWFSLKYALIHFHLHQHINNSGENSENSWRKKTLKTDFFSNEIKTAAARSDTAKKKM